LATNCCVPSRSACPTVVRKVDTLARLGGDEFIIALPGIQAAGGRSRRRLLGLRGCRFRWAGTS
jgi:GGDEF domain-containing protein